LLGRDGIYAKLHRIQFAMADSAPLDREIGT